MAKLTPLQQTKEVYGSKAALAEKVLGFLSPKEGEEQEAFAARIKSLSNKKLLRLVEANAIVTEKYGSTAELAKAITLKKFNGIENDYLAKISEFSAPKLLDLARKVKLGK